MAGGNAFASRVSAALRAAELPVLRYSDRMGRPTLGIRVSNYLLHHASVTLRFEDKDDLVQLADGVEAVLRARGMVFYQRSEATTRDRAHLNLGLPPVHTIHFTVYAPHALPANITALTVGEPEASPAADDPEQAFVKAEAAAIAASGLSVSRATHKDWFIEHGGRRNAYYIERTGGTGPRTRYSVTARGQRLIDKGLRTMANALAAVKNDIDTPTE